MGFTGFISPLTLTADPGSSVRATFGSYTGPLGWKVSVEIVNCQQFFFENIDWQTANGQPEKTFGDSSFLVGKNKVQTFYFMVHWLIK